MGVNKVTLVFILNIFCALASNESISEIKVPKQVRMNFTELSRVCGFNAEEFDVITEDGYILKLFHIPGKKKPVLLVHGIGDTSNTWVLRGNKSLAIALSRKGYDVWAGNVRGNRYGRKHVHLNPDTDETFWDFSFHQLGYYDWPAMIDRVLKETSETKLCAIAHSQGSTSFLVLSSLRPEYNQKIELLIALAPVAFLDHTGPVLASLVKAGPVILPTLKTLRINELLADHKAEKKLIELFCSQGVLGENICSVVPLGIIGGYNPDGIEQEFVSVIFTQYPAGTSRKSLEHYTQIFLSGKFAQFDYGPVKNRRVYGNVIPLEYDLSKVSAKTAIIYGENDQIATVIDVQRLAKLLPNLVYNKAISNKKWNHVDFIWNSEADRYFFSHVFKLLRRNGW